MASLTQQEQWAASWPGCTILPLQYKRIDNFQPCNTLGPNLETMLWQTELNPGFRSVVSWSKDLLKWVNFGFSKRWSGLFLLPHCCKNNQHMVFRAEQTLLSYTDPEDAQITKKNGIIWTLLQEWLTPNHTEQLQNCIFQKLVHFDSQMTSPTVLYNI